MDFFSAMTNKDARTLNNMPAYSTTGHPLVDLFFSAGGSRNFEETRLVGLFSNALSAYPKESLILLFAIRDIRGGLGERRFFRVNLNYLAVTKPDLASKILYLVPEYGRWDDLFAVFGTTVENKALNLIANALRAGDGLCAKWMPREGKKGFKEYGIKIVNYMGLTKKQYRKLLVGCTKVVETKMSKNLWGLIEYDKVPSTAFKNYSNAFKRHDEVRFNQFISKVESGQAVIHASVLFPHDLVKKYISNNNTAREVNAQWSNIPDFINSEAKFLPVCDVSGSMFSGRKIQPIMASVGLSIYLAERNKSAFKDIICTFSQKPSFIKVSGSLTDKITQLVRAGWALNTNIESVFDLMLNQAIKYNVPKEDMPDYIIILSDMQFDLCVKQPDNTAFEMIKSKYKHAGYKLPKVIFWNLNSYDNFPVRYNENGVLLVSGYSPNIIKFLFGFINNPLEFIYKVINNERYNKVRESLE